MLTLVVAAMAIGVSFAALQATTGLGGHRLEVIANDYVYTALELLAAAVCAARVWRRRDDRLAWAFMTLGLVAWTAGDLTWTLWLDYVPNPQYPSVADAFYLTMYPSLYVALMLLIRSRLRSAGLAQWLDGGVVGLTIASAASALVLDTVLATDHTRFIAELVNVAYPVGDLVLLVFVAVAYSLAGWRPGRLWLLLGAGVIMSAAADILFTYESAVGSYTAGTLLDVMWPASMCLFALSAWIPSRGQRNTLVQARHTILLTVAAATGALALLVSAAFGRVNPLAVSLAAGALVLASARAGLTYLENARMLRHSADAARTDALTGLGNRRRLMEDLAHAFSAARAGDPSTLVFSDLNGFKRYNDSFGHAAGDALLIRIGAAVSAAIGDQGSAYRLGGDEFCALLDGRFVRRDGLIAAVSAGLSERGSAFIIGASLGLAVVPEEAPSPSGALQLADARMYVEKARASGISRAQARDVLMALLGERTPGLHEHVTEVGKLTTAVGADLGLDSEQLDELLRAAELHDIGKLAIPDEILGQAGPLADSEWEFMRQHPIIGERILNAAPALRPVARLVRSSHERWDGKGYPDGLSGDQIPLGARIVAACDAYEAMTAERCYQPARGRTEAVAELRREAGSQFDPIVVEVLCRHLDAAVAGAQAPANDAAPGPVVPASPCAAPTALGLVVAASASAAPSGLGPP